MNNQVLRRKLFNAVLKDRSQPSGILASSSELAETVQRRNSGGANFMGGRGSQTVGDAFARVIGKRLQGNTSGGGMPEGTESYLELLETIKDLPYEQQKEILRREGYGAEIGPDVASQIPSRVDALKESVSEAGEDLSKAASFVGDLIAPGTMLPGQRRYQAKSSVSGMPGEPPEVSDTPAPTDVAAGDFGFKSPVGIQQLMDESVAAQLAGQTVDNSDFKTTPKNVILGEYDSAPKTVAEEVSDSAVSGSDTLTKTSSKPAVNLDPAGNLSNFKTKLDNANNPAQVAKVTAPKIKPEDILSHEEEAGEAWTTYINKSFKPSDRVTFSDMEEKAKELMDFDPEAGNKQRKSAFFMNMMKAGLAVAAGQSDNLVTNLAKGLGVGLEGYGEDLNRISAEEREKKKEYRDTVMKMVDSENDYRVAMDGLKQQHQSSIARLAQADAEGAAQRNLQRETAELSAATTQAQMEMSADEANIRNQIQAENNRLQYKSLELNYFKAISDNNFREETLTEQQRSNMATEAINRYKTEIAAMPEEQLKVMAMGSDYILINEDGSFRGFTEEGEQLFKNLILASSKSKVSTTDLMQTARGHAGVGNILGVSLSTDTAQAMNQGLVWESTYNPPYQKALEEDNPAAAEKILQDFASSIGGQQAPGGQQILEFDTQPSDTEIQRLVDSGVSQIKIGGTTYSINPN